MAEQNHSADEPPLGLLAKFYDAMEGIARRVVQEELKHYPQSSHQVEELLTRMAEMHRDIMKEHIAEYHRTPPPEPELGTPAWRILRAN